LVKIDIAAGAWKSRAIFDAARHVGWDALPAGLVSLDWGSGVDSVGQESSGLSSVYRGSRRIQYFDKSGPSRCGQTGGKEDSAVES
jgi:hypothetical protein